MGWTFKARGFRASAKLSVCVASLLAGSAVAHAIDITVPPNLQDVILNAGDTIAIGSDGTVSSANPPNFAITVNGVGAVVRNDGTITGGQDGVHGNLVGSAFSVFNTGFMNGTITNAIFSEGTLTKVTNTGTMTGGGTGVLARRINELINEGIIIGGDHGILTDTIDRLVNFGAIIGSDAPNFSGVQVHFGKIRNDGLIRGHTGITASRDTAGDADIKNSGTIEGTAGIAIDFRSNGLSIGQDSLTLLKGSRIIGAVNFNGDPGGTHKLSFFDAMESMVVSFQTSGTVDIDTYGKPFARVGNTVAVVDPTAFSLGDEVLSDMAGGVLGVIQNRQNTATSPTHIASLGDGSGGTISAVSGVPYDGARKGGVWAQVFGGGRYQADGGNRLSGTHVYGGVVAGADGQIAEATRAGIFFGGSAGTVKSGRNSQDTDIDSVFAGVYVRQTTGSSSIDFALTAGLADFDSSRVVANNQAVNGVEAATTKYDGVFVSPEITVATDLSLGTQSARASLRLRYAGMFLEDYAESGSIAALTVSSREIHVAEARAQIEVPVNSRPDASGPWQVLGRAGVDGRINLGGGQVRSILLGQSVAFDPGGKDQVASAFAGLSATYAAGGGVTVYGGLEASYGTDRAASGHGRVGARIAF